MGVGTAIGGASLIGAGISGASSMVAGNAQADAANKAANLQKDLGQQSLDFQKQQYNTQQQNLAPWLAAGKGALSSLTSGLAPGGQFAQGWDQHFQAPTDVTEQNDPGYKFRLSQGLDALQNSAAARGGLLSGGTARAIDQYAQNDASNEYGNVYARAAGQYQQNYNQFETNQSNLFNRTASLAGVGQTAVGQAGQSGQAAAGNIANILGNTGQQVGQNINNAGAATASGYVGLGNSLNSGVNGVGQGILLQNLLNNSSYGNYGSGQTGYVPGAPGMNQGLV